MPRKLQLFFLMLSIFLVLSVYAHAASSYTYGGKEYYVVTSTDPSMDTGNEVCQYVGKSCAGFDAFTLDVCKYFHPGAKELTSVHGSKTGFYCDGPPQTGLACESQYDTCQICPACNVGIDCGTPIGGLYREMYVQCTGGESPPAEKKCPDMKSKNTKDFMNEISSIHTQLQTCPKALPSAIAALLSTGTIDAQISMKDGSTSTFLITLKKKVLVDISDLSGKLAITQYTVSTDEESFDAILSSNNKFGTIAYLYNNKKITLTTHGLWNQFKFFFIKPLLNIGLKSQGVASTPQPPAQQPNLDYPGKWTCDFYQTPYPGVNIKHVTCNAPMAADNFCKTVLTSPYAKAEVCDDSTGIVVCSNPCDPPVAQLIPKSCPFDAGRARGNQAPPIQNCPPKPAASPASTGPPADCMDTYLAGHDAYQYYPNVKTLWDSYSAKTKGVCQVIKGNPSPDCVYTVQTSQEGSSAVYYLCWYN